MSEDYVELVPVEGHSNLGRDANSNAIVNMDQSGYESYIQAREEARRKDRTLNDLRDEIDELKSLVKGLLEDR
tara:strand:+ start:70 stop:288 length:219 start_codon:yes stop_codon:yes gene_type:complete